MPDRKIHAIETVADRCDRLRADGKSIVLCHGAFDLLHPGHIKHLAAAKQLGDVLVVTLTEDRFIRKGPGRPVFNERLRAETIAAIGVVDLVATAPWATGLEVIDLIRPNVYVKGQDYRDATQDATGAIGLEKEAVRRHGGRIAYTEEAQYSSTKLLNEHFNVLTDEQRSYLDAFREHHATADVLAYLDALASTRVLVIGEAIMDEYHYCTPDAMSNKNPALSVRFDTEEVYAGGVLAVGNNLAGISDHVFVLAGAGNAGSETEEILRGLRPGVRACVVARPDAPTVRKRRFVHRLMNQKLFEVTFLDDRPIPPETEQALIGAIDEHAPKADVVIVLDFGHGFVTPRVVEHLSRTAPFLAVNAQINSSNRGFNNIRKYLEADFISVDEHELRLPFGDRYGPLESLIQRLAVETACRRVSVTLGDRGSLYYDGERFHRAPALTSGTVDAIGAGDAFLALTALLVQAGAPGPLIPFLGNCMGGLMAQIVGHRSPVDPVDLRRFVTTLLK